MITYHGDTTGQPTFIRPLEDLNGLSGLSGGLSYDVRSFTVDKAGSYDIISVTAFDGYLGLYRASFDPNASLANALKYDDDLISVETSGLTYDLSPGVTYFALVTGFNNTDFGSYAVSIVGDGAISPIASGPASPGIFSFQGDTTGGPTFNRPLENLSGLSTEGSAAAYDVRSFTVDTSGRYSFTSASPFDGVLGLYGSEFDPDNPLANALDYNDDLATVRLGSALARDLVAGETYSLVVTGFANDSYGQYAVNAVGPGRIQPVAASVPEPASWALMIAGFGLVGASLRRRKTLIAAA